MYVKTEAGKKKKQGGKKPQILYRNNQTIKNVPKIVSLDTIWKAAWQSLQSYFSISGDKCEYCLLIP